MSKKVITTQTKHVVTAAIVCALLILCVSFGFAISTVTHSGSDIFVTYQGSTMTAQAALSSLWDSVAQGSQALYNACIVQNPPAISGDDINSIPAHIDIPAGAIGHHARQVIVTVGGAQMSAQAAVVGIANELEYIKTSKVQDPCHSYCNGNELMNAGSCNGAGSCGAGFGSSGSDCGSGALCKFIADTPQAGFADTFQGARCVTIQPNRCNTQTGNIETFGCSSILDSSCGYSVKQVCSSTGCDVGSVTCNPPPPAGTLPLGAECGVKSKNPPPAACAAGICYDSNGDGVGACRNVNLGAGSPCDANNMCADSLTCASGTCQ